MLKLCIGVMLSLILSGVSFSIYATEENGLLIYKDPELTIEDQTMQKMLDEIDSKIATYVITVNYKKDLQLFKKALLAVYSEAEYQCGLDNRTNHSNLSHSDNTSLFILKNISQNFEYAEYASWVLAKYDACTE